MNLEHAPEPGERCYPAYPLRFDSNSAICSSREMGEAGASGNAVAWPPYLRQFRSRSQAREEPDGEVSKREFKRK